MKDKYYVLLASNFMLGSHDPHIIENTLASRCCNTCGDLYLEEFGTLPATVEAYLWTQCGAEYCVDEYESWGEYVSWFKETFK